MKFATHLFEAFAGIAKTIAIVLTLLTVLALLALRAFNGVNAGEYAGLSRYRDADAQLATFEKPRRMVFIGDSITDFWDLKKSFPDEDFVNRGIGGQTTSQMVLRFHQDVINLHPQAVIILAGINDIGAGMPLDLIESNYAAMQEMARANRVAVYFASVLPTAQTRRDFPPDKIASLNHWLQEYCKNKGAVYIDYWSQLASNNGFLNPDYSIDGVHLNNAGYTVMQSVLTAALSSASVSPLVQATGMKK